MEENTVDFFDYLRLIWKRKILIIVVISVCIGVGVGVKVTISMSKLPPVISYHADAVVKVGKKVKLVLSQRYSSSEVTYIEDPADMLITVPILYDLKVKGALGYHFDIKQVGAFSLLRLTVKGPDMGVERVLKELVDLLLDKHRRKVKDSVAAYDDFIEKLKVDAKMFQGDIEKIKDEISEMKKREGDYLVDIKRPGAGLNEGAFGGDRSAYLNMLYLKTIDKQKGLSGARKDLRVIERQLVMHKITLGNLEEYKTEVISKVKSKRALDVESKSVKETNVIAVAGVAGLLLSLFIAFFMEYIEESKSRRKGK